MTTASKKPTKPTTKRGGAHTSLPFTVMIDTREQASLRNEAFELLPDPGRGLQEFERQPPLGKARVPGLVDPGHSPLVDEPLDAVSADLLQAVDVDVRGHFRGLGCVRAKSERGPPLVTTRKRV